MRHDTDQFKDLNSEIVVIAPDTIENAKNFFSNNPPPFTAIVDESLEVFQRFDVQSKWISLGQRPGLFIIDKAGIVRFAYIGAQQWEIPSNSMVLEQLIKIERNLD